MNNSEHLKLIHHKLDILLAEHGYLPTVDFTAAPPIPKKYLPGTTVVPATKKKRRRRS